MTPSPARIRKLAPNEVFVFGSNLAGRHGKGAAKQAVKWGAKRGQGMGAAGQTYAIATKDQDLETLPLWAIDVQIQRFVQHAGIYCKHTYLVTEIGCGLAGYAPKDIAPMFAAHVLPDNIRLPQSFLDWLPK